ncbi:Sterol O-acyltransferase 1-like protein, partial [Dinothrombium tinctorium]
MALATGFFFPFLFIEFLGFGVVMFFLTQRICDKHDGGNMFLFGSMFIGWSLLVFFYSIEWYSRINCP